MAHPNIFEQIRNKKVINWLDKLTFFRILVLWALVIIAFGVIYHILQTNSSYLFSVYKQSPVEMIKDSIYFSFVTATTTGFGDIVPIGEFRWITIFEVIFGLILLAVVTSKLVSIKQDAILSELYDISFNERITRLRSSLLLLRQNTDKIITKIEDNSIKQSEVRNVYTYFSSLEDSLTESLNLITNSGRSHFVKKLDSVNAELIFNSIISSLDKLHELISILIQKNIEWKTEINVLILKKCMLINENLFNQVGISKILTKQTLQDLNSQKNSAVDLIKTELGMN